MTTPSRRVLVIEDESGQRAMYERALRSMDFNPVCVAGPREARRRLAEEAFPVVILDLYLAGESGMDLFEELREKFPAMSVIVATGYGNLDLARRSIRLDAVDFLSKPVPLGELERALDRAWARHRLVSSPTIHEEASVATEMFDDNDDSGDAATREDLRIEAVEHELIMEALRRCGENRRDAAKLLGISERKLYYRLTQYRAR